MNTLQIKAKLISILCDRLGVDDSYITSESTLTDLGADYLEEAEIMIEIEKEFNLDLSCYDKIAHENFETLCIYVEKAVRQKEDSV